MKKANRIVHRASCFVLSALCIVPCAGVADAAKDGGLVKVAGKGRLAVVDCTSGLRWEKMKPVFDVFDANFHIEVVRQKGAAFSVEEADEALRKSGANAALFIGEKADYPLSLMASESKWAFINLAPLKADGTNLEKRAQVLLMRGLCRALGSDAARAKTIALAPVHALSDLDKITSLGVGMESFISISESSEALGLEPVEYLTFREACELENPPTPTNDVQKAIAAEVKAAMQKQKK